MRALLIPVVLSSTLSGCAFVSSQDVADQKALLLTDDTADTGDTDVDPCGNGSLDDG